MRILVVHNEYGGFSGEEAVVERHVKLLETRGHDVVRLGRSSAEIPQLRFGKTRAFLSGIYSFSSKKIMKRLLAECRPDILHVHNVFPLISPCVLGECRKAGVPVVMTVHNFRLICPNGLFLTNGRVCERCAGGREHWCVIHNCTGSFPKSVGYALRNYAARKRGFFRRNVAIYMALTEFQRRRLAAAGFPIERIVVVPNMVDPIETELSTVPGVYVAYVGRISPEKDLPTLMNAAKHCRQIAFRAAGSYEGMGDTLLDIPENFALCGHLAKEDLARFYADSRILVLCSVCYEGFPDVLVEAMVRGKPVICSRIGGLPEIVDDGVTGLLFEPGNADDLAQKIRYLWERPGLCWQMGQAGREKALREYSPEKHYERLMAVYKRAIELGLGGAN